MGRAPCCDKMGLRKGPWAPEEDQILINHIQLYGHGNWRALPKQAGLSRCGKSCRLRWINYLRPDIKRGNFTGEEEETIIKLHETLGNRWSAIAARLPGRTDNEIKNVWHTHLKKRIKQNHAAPEVKRHRIDASKFSQESKTELESPKISNPKGSEGSECRPISPQRCSSDISSAITEDSNGNNVSTKAEQLDHFPEMDDKFWTDWNDFPAVGTDTLIQYPLSPIINSTELLCGNNSNMHDSIGFWHSLLIEAGELPGLL